MINSPINQSEGHLVINSQQESALSTDELLPFIQSVSPSVSQYACQLDSQSM